METALIHNKDDYKHSFCIAENIFYFTAIKFRLLQNQNLIWPLAIVINIRRWFKSHSIISHFSKTNHNFFLVILSFH